MLTVAPFHAFGAGPWQSTGFFVAGPLGCTPSNSGWINTGGQMAGFCGHATGYGSYGTYLWSGGLLLAYDFSGFYGYDALVGVFIVAPDPTGGSTCTSLGGATRFVFVGGTAHADVI